MRQEGNFKMIYLNTMQFATVKNNVRNSNSVLQNPPPPSPPDSINFGQKVPTAAIKPSSIWKNIFSRLFNLVETPFIDKFGKKSIEKTKNGRLYEKVLFKKTQDLEFPQLVLKYKKEKMLEAKGLREDGTTEFKRTYDKKGKQISEIFYAQDGKTPVEY